MSQTPTHKFQDRAQAVCDFRRTLTPETDRGCALMAQAYLDAQLEELLRRYFVDDAKHTREVLGQSKPLGTFSARVDVAYALGLISLKMHRDLHLIRKIRNDFGHDPSPINFHHSKIANRCRDLYHTLWDEDKAPRARFVNAVMGVLGLIHESFESITHAPCVEEVQITPEIRRAARAEAHNGKQK